MPAYAVPPDDTLREFLLGTLPAHLADQVRQWLDSDPRNAAQLDRFLGRDPLLDAVADRTPDAPVSSDAIERIVRRLAESRSAHVPVNADTPSFADEGATVPRFVPAPWPPEQLGQFRIIRELGHGGMGYVFEAEDEALSRRVAVKVLTPELARQPEAAARFLREARAAAKVEHENVVQVLHVGRDGTPFMVMPLLQGESLSDRLKRSGVVPIAEVLRVGRDIAAGLSAAHAKGLVHRDLKPANVWLDAGTGRARVLDFGLARHGDGTDALTQSGALAGTPAYMAPELLDGKPATVRSDLFALGAVLYECVTGTRAFDGPTITAILKAVTDHHPTPPSALNPAVPPELSALVVRLLSKNPADRPASAAEVLAALAAILVPPTVPDVPNPPTATWTPAEPIPTPKPRRQIQLGCVITISLCLMIGVGIAAIQTLPSSPDVARPSASDVEAEKRATEAARQATEAELLRTRAEQASAKLTRYRGKVDVLLARTKDDPLMRLNVAGALPMRLNDSFRIEAEVDPPAYLYLIWIDPGRDVTPVYPWNAKEGWGSRPAKEEPRSTLSLPTNVGNRYTADAKPGVTTMVLFACEKPLDAPDDVIEKWFKDLPELPLPPGGESGAVWFDNYLEVKDPGRLRTFGEVEADAFAQWQGKLKKALGGREVFQTAVSFARTGRK